jgi:tRNA pseudouridine55 synthase
MSGHEEGNVYLIDKELGWTSFDVVRKLRKITGERKIGHAGTLDPLATGLLILCSGPMTRRIGNYMESEKEYTGTLVLGKSTASFDLETEVREVADCRHLAETDIRRAAGAFVGDLLQVPRPTRP